MDHYDSPMRIWIDTDIGTDVDDALTLGYVLRHPGFELVGISTVFGDIPLRNRITRALLALGGADDVPVLGGLGVPRSERRKGIMLGHEGQGLLDDADPVLRLAEEQGGPARIEAIAAAIEQARPDAVLAIGPLTNLAALAEAGLTLPPLAIMGGKHGDVMLEDMVARIGEWNWFCDPDAARLVLDAVVGATAAPLLVPAEITFQTHLDDGDVDLLATDDELNQAVAVLCERWLDVQRDDWGRARPRIALHDPLTAAVLVDKELCRFEPMRLSAADDGSALDEPGTPNVELAVEVDAAAVRANIMGTLLGSTPGPDGLTWLGRSGNP